MVWREVASCRGTCFAQLHLRERGGYQDLEQEVELEGSKEVVDTSASPGGLEKGASEDIG